MPSAEKKVQSPQTESHKQHQPVTDSLEQEQLLSSEITSESAGLGNRFDPRKLSPRAILQLQRTIGNQAVMRMMAAAEREDGGKRGRAGNDATPDISTSSASDAAIQRLIGFEIETGIPAKKINDKGALVDPSYTDFNIDLPGGAKLDVDSNPSGGGKILEFASEAVDETQDPKDFAKTASTWLALLTNLREKAAASPPILKLKDQINVAPDYARYGVNTGKPDAMDRASIQATHGLKLEQVREFFKNLTLDDSSTGAGRIKKKEGAAHTASVSVEPIMTELKKDHDPSTMDTVTDNHVEALAGFFALMANYMVSGKVIESGYNKNRSFLFYKSKLSDVRNKLVADNPYAAVVLKDKASVGKARVSLLIVTQRKADEMLWVNTAKPKIADWMDKILDGTDDLAFEAAKNSWGKDIAPGEVEGSTAAVVEHRDIDKVVPPDGELKMSDPDGILAYLTKVFEANKEWEKLKK